MKTRFSTQTLPNGMRIIYVSMTGSETTSLFVYCKVGSRNESQSINGTSHFVEHLLFKGTEKRPTTLAISQELESMGAEFNAFTGKDYTGYYIKAASKHTEDMVDVLHDLLFHATFDPREIHRERTVIIEEIKMYKENPMMHIEDLFEQIAFEGSPLGWSIAGPEKIIARVPRSQILRYKQTFYQPSNMVCVVAGHLTNQTKKMISGFFRLEKDAFKKSKLRTARKRKGMRRSEKRPTAQTQLAIGFQGFSYTHKDSPTLELLSTLLGGSMSSRLFIQVRERKGLCYYIKSDVVQYEDAGLLSIYAGVDSRRLQEAITEIQHVLIHFSESAVSQGELRRAKEYLKGKLVLRIEASEKMAQWFSQEALFMKTIETPEMRLREIEQVNARDIQRIAKRILVLSDANAACIGPVTSAQLRTMFRSW